MPQTSTLQRYLPWLSLGLLLALWLLAQTNPALWADFPAAWNLGLYKPIDAVQSWVIANRATHPIFLWFFAPLSAVIDWGLRGLENILLATPWYVLMAAFGLLGYWLRGWRLALLCVSGLLFMGLTGLWAESMQTLALMGVSVFIALLVGIPLGILAARYNTVDAVLRPILDGMQTMPAFVYLIPVLLFFGVARVPSVIATVIYALPPAIRLTNLGLREVPPTALEAARAFGSTRRQMLFKVQLPLALPAIMTGVNQTIMMALGIVVIAALIGAGGLGREVTMALTSLKVGRAFEAGLSIVLLAIILDRLSDALSKLDLQSRAYQRAPQTFMARHKFLLSSMGLLAGLWLLDAGLLHAPGFPAAWRVLVNAPIDALVGWLRDNVYKFDFGPWLLGTGPLSDFITLQLLNPVRSLFMDRLPWVVLVLGVSVAAYFAQGWRLALVSGLGLLLIGLLGMWELSMDTFSQVLVAIGFTVALAVPLGIWVSRSPTAADLLRPVLDTLQTIPPFVYLVPVIMLFNIGRVPGLIAAVLYALPPGIKLTELGIRQVPREIVEAAHAFGSTPTQTLFKVQLPLALPAILLGINQMIMMILSMVIISGLVGGAGLGLEVVTGLARNQTGRGLEAGLAIVFMAIVIDRLTQAWAARK